MSMKNHLIDTVGQVFEQSYRSFHLALTGLVAESMTGAVPTSARAIDAFRRASDQLEQSTLTLFADWLGSALADAAETALKDTGAAEFPASLPGEVIDAARAVRAEVLGTLSAALQKDCAAAAKRMRDFCLRVDLLMTRRGYPYEEAVRSARIAEQQKPMSFAVLDTLGRKWKPSTYAGSTVRSAMQTTYADTFARAAAALGASQVQVSYPDPSHDGHGQLLSLAGGTHPSYLSMRDEVFHPNSGATLALVG